MSTTRAWVQRLGGLFQKPQRDAALNAELQSHLEMHIADNVRAGMSPVEARRRALIQLDGVESLKETYRDRRGVPWIDHLIQDLRYGVRTLLKNPGFSLAAILALALGIGANTALFSVVYGVLLRPLPFANGDRMVQVIQQGHRGPTGFSVKEIFDYRARTRTLDDVEEYHGMYFNILLPKPDKVQTGVISHGFFHMLGVKPILGRDFIAADDAIGAPPVLILSNGYWKRAFGADPSVIGRQLKMNDKMHTVVGVLPAFPQYPRENDVYMPTVACPYRGNRAHMEMRDMRMMQVFGTLKPGATIDAAESDMRSIMAAFHTDYPSDYKVDDGMTSDARMLRSQITAPARPMLILLIGIAGLVLLICCTNVANLALARTARREHEFSVRAALGASRGRLFRQVLTESTLLSLIGGALGLVFAIYSMGLLVRFIGRFTTRAGEIAMNTQVLLFALGISLLTGILFGLLPAFTAGRGDGALKAVAATTSTSPVSRNHFRGLLIAAEVAVCFVLLSGAGLMVRTLIKLETVQAGYDAENVVSMKLSYDFTKYPGNTPAEQETLRHYEDEIARRLNALPGVNAAGLVSVLPLDQASGPLNANFLIQGQPKREGPQPQVNVATMSPDAFRALGVPLLRGRFFTYADRNHIKDAPIVISESMARHFWPNQDPIGQHIKGDNDDDVWSEIVGVVGDMHMFGLDKDVPDTAYIPTWAQPGNANVIVIRSNVAPGEMAEQARRAVQSIDPEQPVVDVKTLLELRGESMLNTRVTATLLTLFAGLALIIAATGLTGITSFLVSQRTREIGIRIALGAQTRQVLAMVLGYGARLIAIGAVIGLLASLATGRVLEKLLYGVKPVDWPSLAFVGAVLCGTSLFASYLPARRATKVDPMVALRSE